MFELIKLLAEEVIGQLSFESIAERRKDKKLADIGTELMLLYMSLNGVVVAGERILDVLRGMATTQDQKHNFLASALKRLLRQQAEQLVMVLASCCRLRTEIGVIDDSGGRVLSRLLHIKFGLLRNQMCELWPDLSSRRDGTSQLLHYSENSDKMFLRSFTREDVDQVFSTGEWYDAPYEESKRAWESAVKMPLDDQVHSDVAQQFLDSGAEENLKEIANCAQQLRQQIEKHFSITDVLLKVNDARGIPTDPARVLWDVHRMRLG